MSGAHAKKALLKRDHDSSVSIFDVNPSLFSATNAHFLVVGVIGTLGAGKSSIANALVQHRAFGIRRLRHRLRGTCRTKNINIAVSRHERLIVIDVPPLFTAPPLSQGSRAHVRMVSWLLAVAHVVVVVDGSSSRRGSIPSPFSVERPLPSDERTSGEDRGRPYDDDGKQMSGAGSARQSLFVTRLDPGHGLWGCLRVGEMLARQMPDVAALQSGPSLSCATALFAWTKVEERVREQWQSARDGVGDVVLAYFGADSKLLQTEHTPEAGDEQNSPTVRTSAACIVQSNEDPSAWRSAVYSVRHRSFATATLTEREWLTNALHMYKLSDQQPLMSELDHIV